MSCAPPPEIGEIVELRRRQWVVEEVGSGAVPVDGLHPLGPTQHLLSLSSIEDDALGEDLQVVWELEPGAQTRRRASLPDPAGFDAPERLDTFLDAVRWGVVSSADVGLLQAPFRSGVTIEDYQLDPVVRALSMPRVNLLIADDVGLGKTIEAGLVVQELLLRHRARTVLVVCPSSLQIQWREQMRDKFGLDFRIVDSELMKQLRRQRGLHVNPWSHFPRLICSIDFLKRERQMQLLREVLPAPGETSRLRRFDLLIVDEAHNVAPPGAGRYATDSLRTAAIRTLTPHFEHRLFLSATPHNGYPESFSALLELLDNQRFARGVPPEQGQLQRVMVRRLKSDLPPCWDGSPRFPARYLYALEVDYPQSEREAHGCLRAYAEARLARIREAQHRTEELATEFVLKLLKKRLFSSPAAFRDTLQCHRDTLARPPRARPAVVSSSPGILRARLEALEEDYADEEEFEATTEALIETSSQCWTPLGEDEQDLLRRLAAFAEQAAVRADARASALLDWLEKNLRPHGQWNDTRVLIFTEYRATQNWLYELLATQGLAADQRLMLLHGGLASEQREKVKAAFQASPAESPVRILLATDAASEGLDLQNHCSRLIHYEIPWNPNRLEQRNGRIDRHGQRADGVEIFHFVGAGFRRAAGGARPGDLEGDLEFLMRAALKVNTIREDLGRVGPVIAAQVEEAMLGRRRGLDTAPAEEQARGIRQRLSFERTLGEKLNKLYQQLNDTRRQLNLTPAAVQRVVAVGLELAGQPPLQPAQVAGLWPDPSDRQAQCPVFSLPALRGSWARVSEGLAHPHTGKIRPVVFDHDLCRGRDDVVLVHLNHPLVQLSLHLLRAEVWASGERRKLHRVTARRVPSTLLDTPAVIAHGRIVVLGADNQRLHEEIISAGGYLRAGRFARLESVGRVEALLAAGGGPVPEALQGRLTGLWDSHREPLLRALEARMRDRTRNLQNQLDQRRDREIADMQSVLEELRRAIQKELARDDAPLQLALWSDGEREQRHRDREHLRARLEAIPGELAAEEAAIRQRYASPTPRLFPVAVSYLLPEGL